MSSSTTSGRQLRRHLQRLGAVGRRVDFVAIALQQRREAVQRVPIVIGQQDAMARFRRRSRCRPSPRLPSSAGRLAILLHAQRQADQEFAALPGPCAVRRDAAAMHLHELAHQREADAQAALRAMRGAIHLREQLEQARQQLRRNADAVVPHADLDIACSRAARSATMRPPGSVYFAALLSRLPSTCVRRVRSPSTSSASSRHLHHELVPLLGDERLNGLDRARDDRADRQPLAAEIDVAARDARDIQQIVHEPRQVLHLPLDHVARPGELRIA